MPLTVTTDCENGERREYPYMQQKLGLAEATGSRQQSVEALTNVNTSLKSWKTAGEP